MSIAARHGVWRLMSSSIFIKVSSQSCEIKKAPVGRTRALKCRGQLTHGVPYEVKDLLILIPHHTDYTMKRGSNPVEFIVHFQSLWIRRGALKFRCCNLEYVSMCSIALITRKYICSAPISHSGENVSHGICQISLFFRLTASEDGILWAVDLNRLGILDFKLLPPWKFFPDLQIPTSKSDLRPIFCGVTPGSSCRH